MGKFIRLVVTIIRNGLPMGDKKLTLLQIVPLTFESDDSLFFTISELCGFVL